jgi:hypothetical protein
VEPIEDDNFSAQLRALRLILGKDFRPISTEALSALTKIPLISIRAVEAGRRVLNDDDRDAFDLLLGTRWSFDLHQWVCAEAVPERPFSRMEHFDYVNQRMPGRLAAIRDNRDFEALRSLLSNLPDQEAALAQCQIHREVCRVALRNNLPPKVLESLQSWSPILRSKPSHLSAKDRAASTKALADLEHEQKPRSPAGKKKKAQH